MTGPPRPCADCRGPYANVHNHHYDDADGPLCRRCFAARNKQERAENRRNGLCFCGAPVTEGTNPRGGKPWKSCLNCRETRNQRDRNRRQDQRDAETIRCGQEKYGWTGAGVEVRHPREFAEAMAFMTAFGNLRRRSRVRYKQRRERRLARNAARAAGS